MWFEQVNSKRSHCKRIILYSIHTARDTNIFSLPLSTSTTDQCAYFHLIAKTSHYSGYWSVQHFERQAINVSVTTIMDESKCVFLSLYFTVEPNRIPKWVIKFTLFQFYIEFLFVHSPHAFTSTHIPHIHLPKWYFRSSDGTNKNETVHPRNGSSG